MYRRIFKGEEMKYEEMFASRGYRGMNILPFPKHVKDQIAEGSISLKDACKFMR